jgi:hypothetical protein
MHAWAILVAHMPTAMSYLSHHHDRAKASDRCTARLQMHEDDDYSFPVTAAGMEATNQCNVGWPTLGQVLDSSTSSFSNFLLSIHFINNNYFKYI